MTAQTRRSNSAALGSTQKLVLHLLASGHRSARHLAYDWPSLTEDAARGALMRLANRGLVDLAGVEESWGDVRRNYKLTARGYEVERALVAAGEDLDEDADA